MTLPIKQQANSDGINSHRDGFLICMTMCATTGTKDTDRGLYGGSSCEIHSDFHFNYHSGRLWKLSRQLGKWVNLFFGLLALSRYGASPTLKPLQSSFTVKAVCLLHVDRSPAPPDLSLDYRCKVRSFKWLYLIGYLFYGHLVCQCQRGGWMADGPSGNRFDSVLCYTQNRHLMALSLWLSHISRWSWHMTRSEKEHIRRIFRVVSP